MLPQRRNRVWGIATLITQDEIDVTAMEKYYERVLLEMRTNFQFPTDLMFRPQSEQPPKPGLHAKHVENAMQRHFLQKNIFVDCGPSLKRPVTSSGGIPCCMPKHPVYFVDQNRYLNGEDFMNAQGLWPCAFKPEVYREILKTKDLAQDLAGNSFSATVSQAVAVAALVSSSGAWRALSGGGQAGNESSLRRLRGKRKAPEYDKLKGKENGKVSAPRRGGQKRLYKRKVPGVDSRKNNRGKSATATIWDKEQLSEPQWTHSNSHWKRTQTSFAASFCCLCNLVYIYIYIIKVRHSKLVIHVPISGW